MTAIFGVGRSRAVEILTKVGVNPEVKVDEWTEEQTRSVRRKIEDEYVLEGALRSEVQMNIKRLIDIGCYRGLRHRRGLPVRGQRTQCNARTRKGRRRAVAGKKKAPRK